jgi:hypothetical protein
MRCTVPALTPNRSAILRTPSVRPGLFRASQIVGRDGRAAEALALAFGPCQPSSASCFRFCKYRTHRCSSAVYRGDDPRRRFQCRLGEKFVGLARSVFGPYFVPGCVARSSALISRICARTAMRVSPLTRGCRRASIEIGQACPRYGPPPPRRRPPPPSRWA